MNPIHIVIKMHILHIMTRLPQVIALTLETYLVHDTEEEQPLMQQEVYF